MIKTDKFDEIYVLQIVQGNHENTEIIGNELHFTDYNFTIEATIEQANNINNVVSAQVIFRIRHQSFDEDMLESVAGVGKEAMDAYRAAAESFAVCVLPSIVASFGCTEGEVIENELAGKKHIYKKACANPVLMAGTGNSEATELWKLVKDEIPGYLGTKKVYWLKLFTSCYNGRATAEARLNGIVYPELGVKLLEYTKNWSDKKNFHSEKQFIVFIQDDSTYEECYYTRSQIREWTHKLIDELQKQDVKEQNAYNIVTKLMSEVTGSEELARELVRFVPEIYTRLIFRTGESDNLLIVRGDDRFNIKKSQLRSYSYMEAAVFEYLVVNKPQGEESMKVMFRAASLAAIDKAVKEGAKIEDIILTGSAYTVKKDYILW